MSDKGHPKARWLLPIGEEHFTEIGRLAAHWSQVEYGLQKIIWRLVGLPWPECKALTAAQRPETHTEVIKLLVASPVCQDAAVRERIRSIVKRTADLKDPRNNIVHAIWIVDPATLAPLAMKTRIKDNAQSRVPYSPAEIRAVCDSVFQLWQDICEVLEELPPKK